MKASTPNWHLILVFFGWGHRIACDTLITPGNFVSMETPRLAARKERTFSFLDRLRYRIRLAIGRIGGPPKIFPSQNTN